MIRKYGGILLTAITIILVGWWWYITYTNVPEYELYYLKDGVKDTTNVFLISPSFTKEIIFNNKDTTYIFYDKNGKSVILIKKDSLINYVLKK